VVAGRARSNRLGRPGQSGTPEVGTTRPAPARGAL